MELKLGQNCFSCVEDSRTGDTRDVQVTCEGNDSSLSSCFSAIVTTSQAKSTKWDPFPLTSHTLAAAGPARYESPPQRDGPPSTQMDDDARDAVAPL